MGMTIRKFRGEVARQREGRRRGAGRYPAELREFAVAHAQATKAAGGSVYAAARELGISEVTLGNWVQTASEPSKVRQVRVMPEPAPQPDGGVQSVTVTTVSGHVVSGLTVEQAAQLLQAIS